MVDKSKGAPRCKADTSAAIYFRLDPLVLTLETPDLEEIARTIWQRQHDALGTDAITYHAIWRDQSVPTKFWDEFLLDAQAVLSLLNKKHIERQKRTGKKLRLLP